MSTEPRHGDHPFPGAVFLGHSEEYDIWVYPREAREGGTRMPPEGIRLPGHPLRKRAL